MRLVGTLLILACGVAVCFLAWGTRTMAASPEQYFPDQRVAALARAAASGDVATVQRLAAEGVDVNSRGDQGVTPLLWTVAQGSVEGADALMQAGANPAQADDRSRTPLYLAVELKDGRMLQTLLRDGGSPNFQSADTGRSLLQEAVMSRRPDQIDALLKAGADINLPDRFGTTPLINAAAISAYPIILQLLNAGADARAIDKGSKTLQQYLLFDQQRGGRTTESQAQLAAVFDWLRSHGVPMESLGKPMLH